MLEVSPWGVRGGQKCRLCVFRGGLWCSAGIEVGMAKTEVCNYNKKKQISINKLAKLQGA